MYATSFFELEDQKKYVEKLIVPSYYDSFDLKIIEDLALNYVNEVDFIIFTSDVDTDRFPRSKIIGNANNKNIVDKYKMYKKLHKNFLMPLTFKLDSSKEACEIIKNYSEKKFIVKPIIGTGGLGINFFNKNLNLEKPFLLQEFIEGDSVSSSFLSYQNHNIDMVTTSEQIVGSKMLGASEFMYCGNITPLINSNPKLINISTKISKMFKLLGSNGIDFILKKNKVYVIEVNPRIQGTFECVESSFNMNLAKAHMDVCNDVKVNIPSLQKFTVKLLPYSFDDAKYNIIEDTYIKDVSSQDLTIKKGFPISTILVSDRILENAMSKAEIIRKKIYNSKIN
ncbi:MAG: ATP-grasp domain-containing protein [Methanosphaera stadtmanae]|nr:ATP-grasp domain-containing protein [Methanosphaera stadtmanae]